MSYVTRTDGFAVPEATGAGHYLRLYTFRYQVRPFSARAMPTRYGCCLLTDTNSPVMDDE
jgi:hypothetical protein